MYEPLSCDDCGGKGVDLGSLHEPEPCETCHGSGKVLVEMDPLRYHYGERKPVGRVTLPNRVTMGEFTERGRYGD